MGFKLTTAEMQPAKWISEVHQKIPGVNSPN